jgi:hypothetical protein
MATIRLLIAILLSRSGKHWKVSAVNNAVCSSVKRFRINLKRRHLRVMIVAPRIVKIQIWIWVNRTSLSPKIQEYVRQLETSDRERIQPSI